MQFLRQADLSILLKERMDSPVYLIKILCKTVQHDPQQPKKYDAHRRHPDQRRMVAEYLLVDGTGRIIIYLADRLQYRYRPVPALPKPYDFIYIIYCEDRYRCRLHQPEHDFYSKVRITAPNPLTVFPLTSPSCSPRPRSFEYISDFLPYHSSSPSNAVCVR